MGSAEGPKTVASDGTAAERGSEGAADATTTVAEVESKRARSGAELRGACRTLVTTGGPSREEFGPRPDPSIRWSRPWGMSSAVRC